MYYNHVYTSHHVEIDTLAYSPTEFNAKTGVSVDKSERQKTDCFVVLDCELPFNRYDHTKPIKPVAAMAQYRAYQKKATT